MIDRIAEILKQVNDVVFEKENNAESFRLLYLSKKGIITQLFDEFKTIPNDQKKLVGAQLNVLKQRAEEIHQQQKEIEEHSNQSNTNRGDSTLPVYQESAGAYHPLRIVEDRLLEIFFYNIIIEFLYNISFSIINFAYN